MDAAALSGISDSHRLPEQKGQPASARPAGGAASSMPCTASADTLAGTFPGEAPLGASPDAPSTSGTSQPAAAAAAQLPRPRSAEELGKPPLHPETQPASAVPGAAAGSVQAAVQAFEAQGDAKPSGPSEQAAGSAPAGPGQPAAGQPGPEWPSTPFAAQPAPAAEGPDQSSALEQSSGRPEAQASRAAPAAWNNPFVRLPTWTSPQRAFSTTDAVLQWLNTDRRRGSGPVLEGRTSSYATGMHLPAASLL